jgi:hypothetical protein
MRKVLQCPPVPFAPPVPACFTAPHLYLPPLVEDTGTTYTDATEAQAIIDDPLLTGDPESLGYGFNTTPDDETDIFAAFFLSGDTSLYDVYLFTLAPTSQTKPVFLSVISSANDVFTFLNFNGGGIRVRIYNSNGTLRETVGDFSTDSVQSSALPAGRYIFSIEMSASPDFNEFNFEVSSTNEDFVGLQVAATYPGAPCPSFIPYP